MNIHAADGEDIQDNLAGRDDHRTQLVVELEPIEQLDDGDRCCDRIQGVGYRQLRLHVLKTSTFPFKGGPI